MKRITIALICMMLFCVITGCTASTDDAAPASETAAQEETMAETEVETPAPETEETEGGWKDITDQVDGKDTESETDPETGETGTETQEPFDGHVNYTYDAQGRKISDDARGFVSISEAVPDIIVEARYYTTYNFVGDRIDGYEEPVALISREGAEALKEVSDEMMAKGYRLKVYDAYRPLQAEFHFVRWAKDVNDARMKAYFYPDLDKSVLFSYGYIADYSGHCRGSSVDLTLFDMNTGKDVDMGGTFAHFGRESHPDYTGITTEQYNNRMMLRECMMRHGFQPINTEWWHFNLAYEPYPDVYFTFPVSTESVEGN